MNQQPENWDSLSRTELERVTSDERALAGYLRALEKEISRRWQRSATELAERIVTELNLRGHNLKRLEDHILAFADERPEGEKSLFLDIFATLSVSAKTEIPERLEVPPQEKWYLDNVDRIFAKYLQGGYAALSAGELILHDVDQWEREVNNGGFSQYFLNTAGERSHQTMEALESIGAKKGAKLLAEAIALFPGGTVPTDSAARVVALEEVERLNPKAFSRLDSRFYRTRENRLDLLHKKLSGTMTGNEERNHPEGAET